MGRNAFVELLPYLDSTVFWRVGTYHLLYLGLVKAFWRSVAFNLEAPVEGLTLSKDDISKLDVFLTGLHLTRDFNRAFAGISQINTCLCEDWKRLVEVYSVFAFHPKSSPVQLPPLARKMWGHLRRFVLHHTSTNPNEYQPDVRKARQQDILAYGVMMETYCPKLLTINLHRAACWLEQQEERLGLAGHCAEFWGERGIQMLKRITGDRPNGETCKSLCNKVLYSMASTAFAVRNGLPLQSWDDTMALDLSSWGTAYDLEGIRKGLTAMQEVEKEATGAQRVEIESALKYAAGVREGGRGRCVTYNTISAEHYAEIKAGTPRFLVDRYAVINGFQTVTSREFALEEKRKTSLVKVRCSLKTLINYWHCPKLQ